MVVRAPRSMFPLCVAFALGGCAGGDQTVRVPQAIAGGVNDATHTNVVGIAILRAGGLATCTGSLIAPNLVLTARHCVSPVDEAGVLCADIRLGTMVRTKTITQDPYPSVSFFTTTSETISHLGGLTRVSEVLTPPDSTGVALCGRDIALLRLTSPITSVAPVRPRLDQAPMVDEVFTASGYGATNAAGGNSGRRRMRDGLRVTEVGLSERLGIPVTEDSEWVADTGTCRGDSGGPALDELGEVFGVLSRGQSTACESPVYTRVDAFAGWIREEAARAAEEGGYPAPDWVATPEPRAGGLGDRCASDAQCDPSYLCRPTGWARECTTTDCGACPDGWLCSEAGDRCVRDPATRPPPEADAGATADAGPAETDASATADGGAADAGAPSTAAADGSCDAGRVGRVRGAGAWVMALLGAVVLRRRRVARR